MFLGDTDETAFPKKSLIRPARMARVLSDCDAVIPSACSKVCDRHRPGSEVEKQDTVLRCAASEIFTAALALATAQVVPPSQTSLPLLPTRINYCTGPRCPLPRAWSLAPIFYFETFYDTRAHRYITCHLLISHDNYHQ